MMVNAHQHDAVLGRVVELSSTPNQVQPYQFALRPNQPHVAKKNAYHKL
jgi:hypothetical protein